MRRQSIFHSLKLAILTACIAGCGGQETDDGQVTIAVIPKGTTHVFWQSIHAGARKAEAETGVKVIWVGPEKEDDRQQQIALIDNQVINQVDGVVVAPLDETALRRPIRDAVNRSVPVVIMDSALKDADDIYASFVATDNVEGGKLAGRQMAEMLGGKGRVIMLRLQEGSASTEKRENGFLEAIAEFPDIEVASSEQYGGVTTASAQQASENLLLRFKDSDGNLTIHGVFCPNESTTHGMLQALRRQRLAGGMKFIGFDAAPALIEGMEKDEIHGLVVQDPFKMGYLSVKTMLAHLNGESVEKRIDTGVYFVTKSNLSEPNIQELVAPDLAKWLEQ